MSKAAYRSPFLQALIFFGFAACAAAMPQSETALTERIVLDPQSGLAIYGYDPVAYVSEGMPELGSAEHEVKWAGAVWRFKSAANAALFEDHPARYAPRLGGYDPVVVLQGHAAPGNPHLFRIRPDGLYLFVNAQNMIAFTKNHDFHALQIAWQRLRGTLAP